MTRIKSILGSRQIQLTKSLGQNFLHDRNQLDRIVTAAELDPADNVLEIGPGLGPLTTLLVERAGRILAIEKDRRLHEFLLEQFDGNSRLTLLLDDGLRYLERHRNWQGWKVVSNFPYSVASPILVELAEATEAPDRVVGTLQLEVANRLMASPGQPDYGLLTLLIQLAYEPVRWFKIPASCFFPVPDVASACIVLTRRPEPLLPAEQRDLFRRVVKCAFSQRRKMMMKLLKQHWAESALQTAFDQLKVSPQARAEQLTLEQFVGITRVLASTRQNSHD